MSTDNAVLTPVAVDVARQSLRVGLPPMLDLPVPEPGADRVRQGWQELQRSGLADGEELSPFLADALHALHRPEAQVTVVIAEPGGSRQAVLSAAGEFAVLARVLDGALTLEAVPRSGLARIAAALLPEVAPGPGQSVSVPSESVDAAVGSVAHGAEFGVRLGAALRERGVRAEDAEFLAGVLGAERVRAAQFGGRGFDALTGRTTWSPVTVDVLDTAAGRYFAQHRRGQDGRRWFSLAPTDRRRLLDRVGELVRQIQPGR